MPKDRTKAQASVADASARRASAGPVLPRRLGWFGAVALSVLVAQPLAAQWTVTPLTPAGSTNAVAVGGEGLQQVGWIRSSPGQERAAVWFGSAASVINLHPAGATSSEGYDTDGLRQIGTSRFPGGIAQASLWNSTAASRIDLTPPGATSSFGFGIDGDTQCGRAVFAGVTRAGLWNGTAASWVDLHPAGVSYSEALGTRDGVQIGQVQVGGNFRACLWSGSQASFVDLNPPGATESTVIDQLNGRQVGWATIGGVLRAGLWSGTPGSFVSLHPPGASSSRGFSLHAGYQVGSASIGGTERAIFWSGAAESWQDLSSLVSVNASGSQARRIWAEGSTLYVAGFVVLPGAGMQAYLWSRPCPPALTSQPAAAAVCPGGSTTMSVSANPANGPFTYRWQGEVNEIPGLWLSINDGEFTGVATFAGTNTPTLTISGVTSNASGRYRCIIRNTCGESPSDPATLTLCPTDFNCSGGVDPDDLGDYINCYFDTPPCDRADFNADGNIDPDDMGDYINLFFGLPC